MKTGQTVGVLQSDSLALNYATRIIVCLVALGAAILSFDALTALAQASGIRVEFSWIWAVVIDGFIMVATFAAFALKDRTASKYYAWSTLAVFVLFSIAGNAWHAAIARAEFELPLAVAVIVTAIPPLALFLAIHLLVIMVSPTPDQKAEHKKQLERAERLQKIKDKEVEKIERLAAINEVREEAGLELLSEEPRPTRKPIATPTKTVKQVSTSRPRPQQALRDDSRGVASLEAPKPLEATTAQSTISSDSEILEALEASSFTKTEAEVNSLLLEKIEAGEPLPTGKTISEWLGKSERTGQNFIKKFKEENAI